MVPAEKEKKQERGKTTQKTIAVMDTEDRTLPFWSVINYLKWKPWMDTFLPAMVFTWRENTYESLLAGPVVMDFFEERCCHSCGKRIAGKDGEKTCDDCGAKPWVKQKECIFEGCGIPYGTYCDLEEPACGSEYRLANYCKGPFILYIGFTGNKVKAGITSKNRRDPDTGINARLVEQGFDWALVYDLAGKANLKEALDAEKHVAGWLGIALAMNQREVLEGITSGHDPGNEIVDISLALEDVEELTLAGVHDLRKHSFFSIKHGEREIPLLFSDKEKWDGKTLLHGEIEAVKGPWILVNSGERRELVSFHELKGRAFAAGEEAWQ